MFIVGDIGGTKTLFASLSSSSGELCAVRSYKSNDYDNVDLILEDYISSQKINSGREFSINTISLAVAGPVANNNSRLTNLDWDIQARNIQIKTNAKDVRIYNDLQAIAAAVCTDNHESIDLLTLKEVNKELRLASDYKTKAIIAPGTGLGMAHAIMYNGQSVALPSQGGHISFAPKSELQYELLVFLQSKFNVKQIGLELICSGVGIPNIFEFVSSKAMYAVEFDSAEITAPTVPWIIENALAKNNEQCMLTIELFLEVLADSIQAMALAVYATEGIYLAGGIAVALKEYLEHEQFLSNIINNSTMHQILDKFPIYLCQNKNIALIGASKLINLN